MTHRTQLALTCALAFATTASPVAAQNLQYTTAPGDTCPSIAERVYGSGTRIDVIHLYNHLGAMPHRFPTGRVLTLPRTPPPPRPSSDAEVSFVHNDVHSYTPGDHPARLQEPLTRGHRVGTLSDSAAEVTMASERSVRLEENTLVVVLGRYSMQTQQRETAQDTQLERGTLRTQLAALSGAPAPQPIAVATPAAQVAASAGQTEVTVDSNSATRVGVLSGQAEVSAHGQRVVVPEGSGNITEMGHPPQPPHPLPPRPEWDQAPPRIAFIASGTSTAVGSYRVTSRAATVVQWHVQLARDARFREVLVDRRVDPNVNRFEAREMPEGRYFLRVRSVDAQHFESQPSGEQPFAVIVPDFVPSIPGRRAAVRVLEGLYCGLDGTALAEVASPIDLLPGRAHALRCADNPRGDGSAELAIPESEGGLILAQTRIASPEWTDTGGSRRVAVRVTDAVGAPLAGMEVTARVDHGASVSVVSSAEPGTHFATVQWHGTSTALAVHLAVGGHELSVISIPAAARPATIPAPPTHPTSPVEPLPPLEPDRRFSAGLGVGTVVSLGPLGAGFASSVSARRRFSVGPIDIFLGLGLGVEAFACGGGTPTPAGYCARTSTGPQDLSVTVETASVGVPLGVSHRFGHLLTPYVSVEPELVLGRSRIAPSATQDGPIQAGFGLRGMLGAELDLGVHAPFVEVGYRYAQLPDTRLGTLDVGGPAVTLGYRAQW